MHFTSSLNMFPLLLPNDRHLHKYYCPEWRAQHARTLYRMIRKKTVFNRNPLRNQSASVTVHAPSKGSVHVRIFPG